MTKDMTNGSPMKLILGFSIPLLCGFLFQQFYTLADTVIVGRCLGMDELAAVGATYSLNYMIIGFCMGTCSGFAIPISHKFGAGDESGLRRYVANCIWLTAILTVAITAATVALCRPILVLMRTPENILEDSYRYIVVIFLGIPVAYLYNLLSAIIRALGDSRTPVIFLVISSFLNIALDLILIQYFQMGVEAAAWATVISQGISGVCCLFFILRRFEILHIRKGEWNFDSHKIMVLCSMGVPMGLQYSVTAIGSVVLQSATNTLGSAAVASVTAGNRIINFLSSPFDALGATMATYGGQNVGAGKLERVGTGLKSCVILGCGYSVLAFLFALFMGHPLAGLFVEGNQTVILDNVKLYLVLNTAFYVPLALVNIIRFLIQGMGFPPFAILAGVFEMIARALTGIIFVPLFGYAGACLGGPAAWILADAFLIPAYFHVKHKLEERNRFTMGEE